MGDLRGDLAVSLTSDMLWTAAVVSAPLIAAVTIAGLLISIFQVVTQIQENSLTFVPKLAVAFVVLLGLGSWMLSTVVQFATHLIANIPNYF
jgi:flagellar biosynthesis protein FliQ